jgi:acetyl-CoA C-acetyltransferase
VSTDVVLVGVGEAREAGEAIDLMALAATRALDDTGRAGAGGLRIDAILVPRGSWDYEDPGHEIGRRLGWPDASVVIAELGVSQQGVVQEAMRLLSSGAAEAVLVVGGESRRTSSATGYRPLPGTPDVVLERPTHFLDDLEIEAGLAFPAVRSYALMQRALDHKDGCSEADGFDRTNRLWASMSDVAAATGRAAFEAPRDAAFLGTASSANRPMAAPYLTWHCSQWTVDEAAALLLTTEDAARRAGLDPAAALRPHVALESTHAVPLIQRADLAAWPAMGVLGRRAAAHLGRALNDVEHVDLYSCFPVAVMIQAAELDLPLDPVPSVTGSMTFTGGPFNNYVLSAHVAMARLLREQAGSLGLVTTVSGLLTKPGLGVWSTTAHAAGALVGDCAAEAASVTEQVRCTLGDATLDVTIEAATAFVERGVQRSIVLGRDHEGDRRLLLFDDEASFERFSTSAAIGERLR